MGKRTKQIELTSVQSMKVGPLIAIQEPGGAIIAQVYKDGMVCKVLTPEEAMRVCIALGGNGEEDLHSTLSERNKADAK